MYISSFVAYGIAKKTEDYLAALYRWSAGPLELMWPSLFHWKYLKHYIKIFITSAVLFAACFKKNGWYYIGYLGMLILLFLKVMSLNTAIIYVLLLCI